jgi:DNA-binding NtrC family response regulator
MDERLEASEKERRRLAGKLARRHVTDDRDLAWDSPAMQRVRHEAERMLRVFQGRGLPLLVTGESGTGKEVLARWLHEHLDGEPGPFVAVNCAAIPQDLAESELFGIEQGVASGVLRRIGKFQQASGGTLFLDEIGEMDLSIQTKLLRVFESHRIVRVGGREEIPVDLRVVSATNSSLEDAIRAGTFREDLYWRLCGVQIRMPPLRERREDVPTLCHVFLRRFAEEFGLEPLTIEPEAMARLQAYHWPGNVRELRQRVGALVALSGGGTVGVEHLPPEIAAPGTADVERPAAPPAPSAPSAAAGAPSGPLRALAEVELDHIRRVLAEVGGNATRAAAILGIHKKTLRRKLDKAD